MNRFVLSLLTTAALGFSIHAMAQGTVVIDENEMPNEGQAAFARAFVDASNGDDAEAFWALVHPDSFACLTDEVKAFSTYQSYERQMKSPIPDDYKVQVSEVQKEDIEQFFPMLFGEGVEIPVMPTHSLTIHYNEDKGKCPATMVSRMSYVAEKDGKWYEAMPCPKAVPMSAADMKAKVEAQEAQVDAIYNGYSETEKQELRKMVVDDNDKIMAMKKIADAHGGDMALARDVAEKFCFAD